jgi:probable HAF family extracellular repeat protein
MRMKRAVFLGLVIFFLAFNAYADDTYWDIVALGSLGGTYTAPYGVSNRGEVVGVSSTNGNSEYHAFWYDDANKMVSADPGVSSSPSSMLYGINNSGHAAGWSRTSSGTMHATVYTSSTGISSDIGALGATFSTSYARSINDSGVVVGESLLDSGVYHPFMYTEGGGMTDLGTLGGVTAYAYDINASNQVTGYSLNSGNTAWRAYKWDPTNGMTDIGTLGGANSFGSAINDSGKIVGNSETSEFQTMAFMYDEFGMNSLGALGGTSSAAHDINKWDQVVGYAAIRNDAAYHAFLFEDDVMIDLNDYLEEDSEWILEFAYGINDLGQIVGTGTFDGNPNSAFLMSPITVTPEPLSSMLFSVGLGAIGLAKRKKK